MAATPPRESDLREATQARRAPMQKRSRERVERILEVAAERIAAAGSDQLRMSEVADQAGISIGSLYQYFPDKAAIVRTLAQRYNAVCYACVAEGLADVADFDGLRHAFGALVDVYHATFLNEPVIRDIWSGTQADNALREIDLEDCRRSAALLADVLRRLRPDAPKDDIDATAFLVMNLGDQTMRLAIGLEREEGDRLVEVYKRMALRELASWRL